MPAADFSAVCGRELTAVLELVGLSQHLYICGVDKAFRQQYHKNNDKDGQCRCETSYKAAFESASRLTWAVQTGLV